MPVRPTLQIRIKDRDDFKRLLYAEIDRIEELDLYDKRRQEQLAVWFDRKLGTKYQPSASFFQKWKPELVVWQLLGDKNSVRKFKDDLRDEKYLWARIVIDRAANRAQKVSVPTPKQTPGKIAGGTEPLGLRGYAAQEGVLVDAATKAVPRRRVDNPYAKAAGRRMRADVRAGKVQGTVEIAGVVVQVEVAGRWYTAPKKVWLDDKELAKWMEAKALREPRFVDALWLEMHKGGSGGRDWVGMAARKAYKKIEKKEIAKKFGQQTLSYEHIKIPFGKFKGQRLVDATALLDPRSGKRRNAASYLLTIEHLRNREVPGTGKTYAQQYVTFYVAFDAMTRQPGWKNELRRFEEIGDEASPRDLQPYLDPHRRRTAKVVRKFYGGERPDRDTLRRDLRRGRITRQEFELLWTDETDFAETVRWADYSERRQGGFAPSDIHQNPWLTKTADRPMIHGVNLYEDLDALKRGEASLTPQGKRQARSHFFQQQTYPYSMVKRGGWQRYIKESDPEYWKGGTLARDEQGAFRVVYKKRPEDRYAPKGKIGQYLPGAMIRSLEEGRLEEFLGGPLMMAGFKKLPWSERQFLRKIAELETERWIRSRIYAEKLEDILGPRAGDVAKGTYGGARSADIFDMDYQPFLDEEENWRKELHRKHEDVREKELGPWEKTAAATSRRELEDVALELKGRVGGFPEFGESPAYEAFEKYWKDRYNVLALAEGKRMP